MGQTESFGRHVRERRRSLDLTQEELARRVGCAAITIRKIEADDLRPSVQIAERLAMALAIPLDDRAEFVRRARIARPEPASAPTPTPAFDEIGREDLSGRAIRGYALAERIGQGGMGAVYRAIQPNIEREVAIKIILPAFANHPEFIRRFEAEAQLIARLEHPHIVPLYDFWREPGVAYLVMRLLRGGTMQSLLQNGPLPVEMVLQMLEQICPALQSAHRIGVIHRDLKPANVLLDEDHNAYLADFGVAKVLANPVPEDQTQADTVLGSPQYMSPEQIRSLSIRPQTDIYCLGVMLYEMLTGTLPFTGPTPFDLIQQHVSAPMPPLSACRPGLPAALDAVIARAAAKDQQERYPDVLSLLDEFRQALGGSLAARTVVGSTPEERCAEPLNPYKGLRAFAEADSEDFFGRETLIQQILARLGEVGDLSRFLAVVGPSGSGKSSVVEAGLVPALRRGGLPGSDSWFIVDFKPGPHPFEELEAALLRVAVNPPVSLLEQLKSDSRGLLRAVNRVLPADESVELVMVIDQFEELFTLTSDEAERAALMNSLTAAVMDEHSRVRIIITLRADFIDHPLRYVDFGELVQRRNELILPLTPDELERAIIGPAHAGGIQFEPGLTAAIIREVGNQSGALPLLQYALTELFDEREGRTLTRQAYARLGGVSGALGRRAEEVYAGLDEPGRLAARQLLLRLVTLGEGVEDTRRRALRTEIDAIATSQASIARVLESFGKSRLLTFDRDPLTRGATVEVAHEALLREWPRLREWLRDSQADVRMQRQLAQAARDWQSASQDASFLLSGARLDQFEAWSKATVLALTTDEQAILQASLAQRAQQQMLESERRAHEAKLERRARRVLQMLVGVFLLAALVAGGLTVWANFQRQQAVAAENQAVANLALSDAQRLAAESKTLIMAGENAPTAALLALRSIGLHYTPQGDEVLSQALQLDYPLHVYAGHAAQLWNGGFLLGNKVFFTSSSDATGTIRFWDAASGKVLRSFDVDKGCFDAKLSPDGKFLAAGCYDGIAHVWNLDTGREVGRFEHQAADNPRARFSPDGKQLLTAGFLTAAKLWDIASGRLVREFSPGDTPLPATMDAAFTADGRQLVTGGQDGVLRVWDIATGAQLRSFGKHSDFAWAVEISPDGQYVLTSSFDSSARLWDFSSGQEIRRFIQSGGMSYEAAFSPDGRYVLTGGWDNTVRLWDAQTGSEIRRFNHPKAATGLSFSSDGKYVLTTAWDQVARLWELWPQSGLPHYAAVALPGQGKYGVISPDGKRVAVTTPDNNVTVLDEQTGRELQRLVGASGAIWSMDFSPDGRYLATVSSGDGTTRVWDTQTGKALWTLMLPGPQSVAYSKDGRRLMIVGPAGLYDAATGKLLRQFDYPEGVLFGAYAPDGTTIAATVNASERVLLWDAATGQILHTLHADSGDVMRGIAYSPDGKYLAAGGNTGTIHLWDVATGRELRRFVGHTNTVERALAFSPDGRYLASGSFDRTIRIWDVASGKELRRIAGITDFVASVAFTPDGRQLLSVSGDGARMTYVLLQDAIEDLCGRQIRDFLPDERTLYNITDPAPTCPNLQPSPTLTP